MNRPVIVRQPGLVNYAATLADMQKFNQERAPETHDEIWMLEHPPVFTLGMNADESHIIDAGNIPVVKVDRGGEVTYHGPGQLAVYVLIDLMRARLGNPGPCVQARAGDYRNTCRLRDQCRGS